MLLRARIVPFCAIIGDSEVNEVTSKEWFTVDEAAEYLRVSRRTIYKLTEEGRLPAFRIGQERHRRFRKEDLDKVPMAGVISANKDEAEKPPVGSAAEAAPAESMADPPAPPAKPVTQPDQVLARIWDNEKDSAYDRI